MGTGQDERPDPSVEYREVTNWPGYHGGTDGSVWSCRKIGGIGGVTEWGTESGCRRLKAMWHPRGYLTHSLRKNGQNRMRTVHRIILETFVGPRPPGMEGCHRDGDRSNNRLDNLRWDTRQANVDDRTAHGTCPEGERHYLSKLTRERVIEIRRLHTEGWSYDRLANRLGLNYSTVRSAIIRETWKHV